MISEPQHPSVAKTLAVKRLGKATAKFMEILSVLLSSDNFRIDYSTNFARRCRPS
jgi:hypothetical protein